MQKHLTLSGNISHIVHVICRTSFLETVLQISCRLYFNGNVSFDCLRGTLGTRRPFFLFLERLPVLPALGDALAPWKPMDVFPFFLLSFFDMDFFGTNVSNSDSRCGKLFASGLDPEGWDLRILSVCLPFSGTVSL